MADAVTYDNEAVYIVDEADEALTKYFLTNK